MKLKPAILALAAVSACQIPGAKAAAADQYWRITGSGTWTGSNWGSSAGGPFTTAWTSANNAIFNANSTVTFATTAVANVTVANGITVTVTSAGTLTPSAQAGGIGVSTFDVGTGSLLTWASQNWATTAGAGFIKNGAGTWDMGANGNAFNATNGGFTLNAGTVIASGNNSFGGANSVLTLNGGTIQSSSTRAYANNITVGGNFINTGTGNATFSGTVGLGAATRTITNSTTSGSRIYSGIISGTSGSGLTFDGAGAGATYIGNVGNTFTGTISIKGSEVGFASDGALGNTANTIAIDGGRLTSSTTAAGAVTATWSSTHSIQLGDTAGTSISVVSGSGDLTYNGVISDITGKTGAWAKQGGGILRLGGVSTYTGATAINNGIVQLTTGNDRLPTGTVVSLGQASSTNLGTLDLNGRSQQIAGLVSTSGSNAGTSNNTVTSVSAATLTINTAGSNSYSYGDGTAANSGVITGAISLVKSGTGTQTLGDANTYTGTTSVTAGTLAVNGSLAAGSVTVSTGGTLLGNGTIGGATTISGTHSAGSAAATVGTQNFSENLTYAASNSDSSIFSWDLNSSSTSTGFDMVIGASGKTLLVDNSGSVDPIFKIVVGATAAGGIANVNNSFWDTNQTWSSIFSGFSTITGGFTNLLVVDTNDSAYTSVRGSFSVSGTSVTWTAVPEPTSALAGLLITAGLLRRRRVA